MANLQITEIKTTLDGECKQFDCELLSQADGEVTMIYRMPEDMLLEDVWLPRETVSIGYFWQDRPYNLYHWVDSAGQTLALYFNICDNTHISKNRVAWRDLTVDVLITPDLRCRVLDEDELPDDLDENLQTYIEAVRDSLCANPPALLRRFAARSRQLLSEV